MDQRTIDRFQSKVRPDPTGCLMWTAGVDKDGYGRFSLTTTPGRYVEVKAHRFAYELAHGPIPAGLVLDHLCRIPGCVNPDHLEPVTHAENIARGIGPSATNSQKAACDQGHAFSMENTRVLPSTGERRCRTCEREAARRYRARHPGRSRAASRKWRATQSQPLEEARR